MEVSIFETNNKLHVPVELGDVHGVWKYLSKTTSMGSINTITTGFLFNMYKLIIFGILMLKIKTSFLSKI